MKFTSRGFKAAAAVLATASLLGAGLLPAQAAPKTITVWADETRGPQLKSLIDGNTSIAPGYVIKVKFFASLTALQSAWEKATAAGGPDVLTGPASFNLSAKSGKLLPLLYSKTAQSEIPAAAKQALSYKGRTYGVPLDVDTTAMYFNTAFGASAPATMDAMYELYKTQKAAGKVTGGICAIDGTWGAHPVLTALGGGAYGFTSNNPDANKVLINSAAFKANVKKYLVGTDGKSTGFLKWDGCKDEFLAGKMLAANTGAWNLDSVNEAKIKFTLGAVPGLTTSSKGSQWVNYSAAWVTSYARTHGVELGAKKLVIDWMASSAGQLQMYAAGDRPPANKKAAAAVKNANTKAFAQAAATGVPQFDAYLNDKTGGSNWYDTLGSALTNMLVKGDSVDTTLDAAAVILKKNFANASK
jgi:arabinogalactan oligomer/maltooligosaccharide transport system substrate-binding protein